MNLTIEALNEHVEDNLIELWEVEHDYRLEQFQGFRRMAVCMYSECFETEAFEDDMDLLESLLKYYL